MKLFGHEFKGFAKVVVILVGILLVSSGLCGLQALVVGHVQGGFGPVMATIGVIELVAIVLSVAALMMVVPVWIVTVIAKSQSGPTSGNDQKPPAGRDDIKRDQ